MAGMSNERPYLSDLREGFTPHPPAAEIAYRDAGLFRDRPLAHILFDSAEKWPSRPAVTDADGALTYEQLRAAALRRAAGFASAGLEPGQRAVLQLANSTEFAVSLFGLLLAGVVPVMALPAHRISEIAHLARHSEAAAYIAEDGRRGWDFRELAAELAQRAGSVKWVFIAGEPGPFEALPEGDGPAFEPFTQTADFDPDLPALFLTSGGTTGLPKLIARSHNDYDFNARRSAEIAGLAAEDVYLAALPAGHNFPLCCPGIFGALSVGAHVVFTDNPSPDNAFEIIERHGVTVTALVPALAQLWRAAKEWEPADTSSLRLLQVGGSKLAHPDAVALDDAFGPVTQQVFGMAEGLVCYTRPDEARALVRAVQGRPMCEWDEVRVVDEQGADVPDGVDGELLVRGPYTLRGYYRAEAHNARSFTPDGYFRSGDRVTRRPSGHIEVTGRIKDTIVRAGENVACDDIEEHLLAHPAVWQAAVIGLPDETLGEKICAAVVPALGRGDSEQLALPSVRAFLTERGLASFKLPDTLRLVRSLPVTPIGKIDRKKLAGELG
jgi:mycobactin salicyl-AMP ligase